MHKIINAALLFIALMVAFSFSQESIKFGIQAAAQFTDPVGKNTETATTNYGYDADDGYAAGFGVSAHIPIIAYLSFNPDIILYYKELYRQRYDDRYIEEESFVEEFTISIPAMFQFAPGGWPFYVAAGVQFDIPLKPKEFWYWKDSHPNTPGLGWDVEERATFDFGIAAGIGYNIWNFRLGLKYVIGLTNIVEDSHPNMSGISVNQYGFNVTGFF